MSKAVLFYSEDFKKLDFGIGHPMRGDRYEKALLEFKKEGLLKQLELKEPRLVSKDILEFFHTREYIKRVEAANEGILGYVGEEAPAFRGIFDVGLLSVSAGLNCADELLKGSFELGINFCGGWHHAFEDRGRGFCIFNDII